MKVEINVPEMAQVFKEIQEQPEKILEMVRADMPLDSHGLNYQRT